jgi:hypothetical protein
MVGTHRVPNHPAFALIRWYGALFQQEIRNIWRKYLISLVGGDGFEPPTLSV